MSLIPFVDANDNPTPGGMYVAAILCQALYAVDREPWDMYADMIGGEVTAFESDPEEFVCDVGVITCKGKGMVVFDGTTNATQWIAHFCSSYFPGQDFKTPALPQGHPFCLGSAVFATNEVENLVDFALEDIGTGPILLAGHSFGAGCAFVWGRRSANALARPSRIDLLTFGEPKIYDGRPVPRDVDTHNRIIATLELLHEDPFGNPQFDPVTSLPPGQMTFLRLPIVIDVIFALATLGWKHYGNAWSLNTQELIRHIRSPLFDVPFLETVAVLGELPYARLHLMATSYLAKCRFHWQRSGQNPELAAFEAKALQYIRFPAPIPDNIGPPTTNAALNTAFFPAVVPAPIDDTNRREWETVSASGYFLSPVNSPDGVAEMSLFKGTMSFNTLQGGFSESLYDATSQKTQQQMAAAMQLALAARCAMSMTSADIRCLNPIIPVSLRVEDDRYNRDALAVSLPPTTISFPVVNGNTPDDYQNLNLQLGARVAYTGGSPRQNATICHHGFPIWAAANPLNLNPATQEPSPTANWRELTPIPAWLARLRNYLQVLAVNQLGFRTIRGVWNDPIGGGPGPYSRPTKWTYNAAQQMIELQWDNTKVFPQWPANPAFLAEQVPYNWPLQGSAQLQPALAARTHVQIRGWKGFQVLNGRWASEVVVPQTGMQFALRILRVCRRPTFSEDTVPFVSPIAWSYWFPGQNLVPPSAVNGTNVNVTALDLSGVFVFIESKKLGANFELQRGRQRNRPT